MGKLTIDEFFNSVEKLAIYCRTKEQSYPLEFCCHVAKGTKIIKFDDIILDGYGNET